MKTVRIASGSGYWGDAFDPAQELVRDGSCSYVCFDYLAELTMAILQRKRQHDESEGFIHDMVNSFSILLPEALQTGTKLISNGGGANPSAAAERLLKSVSPSALRGLSIGVVTGDDVLADLPGWRSEGMTFPNLETGEDDIGRIEERIVAAYVYLGADRITDAIDAGVDAVITGRVSDSALYLGPMNAEFDWSGDQPNWDLIGAGITIGHILECAACSSGGMSTQWERIDDSARIGFPFADVDEDGSAEISKLPGTGGRVDSWTVKEHLLYETGDPSSYVMPDGIADFSAVHLTDVGPDRVRVDCVRGRPAPQNLKLCLGFQDGWISESFLLFPWPKAIERAQKAEEIVRDRLRSLALSGTDVRIDYVGINALGGGTAPWPEVDDVNEVGLRIAVHAPKKEDAESVRREATHLWTFGPSGTALGTPHRIRPVVGLWPTLVPRTAVKSQLDICDLN